MACKFKYIIDGVESKLYTELYGYMDTTTPEKKSAKKVYKILEDNAIIATINNARYVHTFDVQSNLEQIDIINKEYPGLINTRFVRNAVTDAMGTLKELHEFSINEPVLTQIPTRSLETADFISNDQTEIDQYIRLVAGEENTDDYYLSEKARLENRSDESRFSDLNKEEIDRVEGKVVHLQDSFASAGIMVEIEYDTEIPSIALVERKEDGSPTIKINPNIAKEDTVYHEFGHIYVDLLGVNHPLVQSGINQLKGTDLYEQVKERYPEYTGEMLDKEVLVTAIGLEGAKITRQNPNWMQQLINRICKEKLISKYK